MSNTKDKGLQEAKVRKHRYKKVHSTTYGIEVCDSDMDFNRPTAVACRFCKTFGREAIEEEDTDRSSSSDGQAATKKRKSMSPNSSVKVWRQFRTDSYTDHHTNCDAKRWVEYKSLKSDEKFTYFDKLAPSQGTIKSYFKNISGRHQVSIHKDIVEGIIRDLLFEGKEEGTMDNNEGGDSDEDSFDAEASKEKLSLSQAHAMNCFIWVDADDADDDDDDDNYHEIDVQLTKKGCYFGTFPSQKVFDLVVEFLGHGLSFTQVEKAVNSCRKVVSCSIIKTVTRNEVQKIARIICAVSLDTIRKILNKVWCFSVALDMSNHQASGYFGIRVRVFLNGKMHNLHVMALPIFTSHKAKDLYDAFQKLFRVLCPDWRRKILSCTINGEAKMTGRKGGFVTLLDNEIEHQLIPIWCGAHELDLIMGRLFKSLNDGSWYQQLTTMIDFFRRQQKFCQDLGSRCPKVAMTRWLSMHNTTCWMWQNGYQLYTYCQKNCPNKVSDDFWVYLAFVHKIADLSSTCLTKMQGKRTTLERQKLYIDEMTEALVTEFLIAEKASGQDESEYAELLMEWMDGKAPSWICEIAMTLNDLHHSLCRLGSDLSTLVTRLRDLSAAQDEAEHPLIYPIDIAGMPGKRFKELLKSYSNFFPSAYDVAAVEHQFLSFESLYNKEKDLRKRLKIASKEERFEDTWKPIASMFPRLYEFFGSLATIFPGTATVESDFSHLKMCKDMYSTCLSDYSLEAKLQTKQWNELNSIKLS